MPPLQYCQQVETDVYMADGAGSFMACSVKEPVGQQMKADAYMANDSGNFIVL